MADFTLAGSIFSCCSRVESSFASSSTWPGTTPTETRAPVTARGLPLRSRMEPRTGSSGSNRMRSSLPRSLKIREGCQATFQRSPSSTMGIRFSSRISPTREVDITTEKGSSAEGPATAAASVSGEGGLDRDDGAALGDPLVALDEALPGDPGLGAGGEHVVHIPVAGLLPRLQVALHSPVGRGRPHRGGAGCGGGRGGGGDGVGDVGYGDAGAGDGTRHQDGRDEGYEASFHGHGASFLWSGVTFYPTSSPRRRA